jgi:hypothetical protein
VLTETAVWICVIRHQWSASHEGTLWHHKEERSDKSDQYLQNIKPNYKPLEKKLCTLEMLQYYTTYVPSQHAWMVLAGHTSGKAMHWTPGVRA